MTFTPEAYAWLAHALDAIPMTIESSSPPAR